MDEIREELNNRIDDNLGYLATEDIGSDASGNIIDDTVKLYKLRLEENQQQLERDKLEMEKAKLAAENKRQAENLEMEKAKLAAENKRQAENLEMEKAKLAAENKRQAENLETEKAKLKEQKLERYFSTGLKVAMLTGTVIFTILGFAREFDGTITSDTLKRNLNFWKPKEL